MKSESTMSNGFPTIRKSKITGETGVNAVSKVVNDEFQWIFRRNHDEHDFGIDGYLDIVTQDGAVTGQSLAVQVKSGQSFFKTRTSNGFTFYGEKKHLNYYLNQKNPILIIIHDDKLNQAYWQVFELAYTERTPTGWKMNIPRKNRFDISSKEKLLEIVGPAEDHLEALEAHWAFNETLLSADVIHYAIDREDIETKNVKPISEFFSRIESNDSLCRKFQGKVEISVSGYDFDKRELWEIREVRRWYKKADPRINWLYFCNMIPPAHGFRAYAACLCDTRWLTGEEIAENPGMNVTMDLKAQLNLFESNWEKLNSMTDHLGMSIEENKRITYASFDAIGFPYDKNA